MAVVCPDCHTENRDGARFCKGCGATLSLAAAPNPGDWPATAPAPLRDTAIPAGLFDPSVPAPAPSSRAAIQPASLPGGDDRTVIVAAPRPPAPPPVSPPAASPAPAARAARPADASPTPVAKPAAQVSPPSSGKGAGLWIGIGALALALAAGAGGWYYYAGSSTVKGTTSVDPVVPAPVSAAPPAAPVVDVSPPAPTPAPAPAEPAPVVDAPQPAAVEPPAVKEAAPAPVRAAPKPRKVVAPPPVALAPPPVAVAPAPVPVTAPPPLRPAPQTACAGRNFIAMAQCMAAQCNKAEFKTHPQCDAVRKQQRLEEEKRNPALLN